jgi:tetratricopeptide (TPR) repeat protein
MNLKFQPYHLQRYQMNLSYLKCLMSHLLQKYLKLVPGAPDAMFQLAQVCDTIRDCMPKDKPSASQQQQLDALAHESSRLYKDVTREVPCDPSANSRYAQHLQGVEQEDGEAFHYMGEAHKHFPVDLDVVSWLGAYYVKSEMYEEAMAYFVRASFIQPKEKKWKLMVASCHRRVGASQQALQVYEAVEKEYPEDLECLTYLQVLQPLKPCRPHTHTHNPPLLFPAQRICSDLGMLERASRYSELLAKAERKADKQRAEAVTLGTGAFVSADQDADSVSMDSGVQVGAVRRSHATAFV